MDVVSAKRAVDWGARVEDDIGAAVVAACATRIAAGFHARDAALDCNSIAWRLSAAVEAPKVGGNRCKREILSYEWVS